MNSVEDTISSTATTRFTGTCSVFPGGTISNMASQSVLPPPPVAGESSPLPSLKLDSEPRSRLSTAGLFLPAYGWVLLVIRAVAWYLRARGPNYSSAFMDESIYVVYGRMFLAGHFEAPLDHPLQFSFGWYLWPALAATADRLGGLAGVRELLLAMPDRSVFFPWVFGPTFELGKKKKTPPGWPQPYVFLLPFCANTLSRSIFHFLSCSPSLHAIPLFSSSLPLFRPFPSV